MHLRGIVVTRGNAQLAACALVILIAIVGGFPLLTPRLLAGHDTTGYIPRLVEFHENIRYGIFPPRWAPDLGFGHGEPLWILAPPLFQIIGEIFHLLGASFVVSENLSLLGLYTFGGLIFYFFGRRVSGTAGGIAGAAAFLFAPYVLTELYVRHAAAEFAGLCFLPLILLGLDGIVRYGRARDLITLALGVGGAGLSHSTAFLIAILLGMLMSVALAIGTNQWRVAITGITGILLGAGIAAFSWLPAAASQSFTKFDLLRTQFDSFWNHFVYPRQLLYSKWGYGLSVPGPDDGMSFAIGLPLLALAVFAVIRLKHAERVERAWIVGLASAAALGAFLTTSASAPIWTRSTSLQLMIFPWRFLLLATICLVALAPFAVRGNPRVAIAISAVIVAVSIGHARPSGYLDSSDLDYTPQRIATSDTRVTIYNELQPIWVTTPSSYSPVPFDPPLSATTVSYGPTRRLYDVAAVTAGTARLHLFFFPGWKILVDGREAAARPTEGTGLTEFAISGGAHRVEARFERTRSVIAGEIISVISLAALVLIGSWIDLRALTAKSTERVAAASR